MVTFEDRKYKGFDAEDLNQVLSEAMEILKNSELGRNILAGANYKAVVSNEQYEEAVRKMHAGEKDFAVDEVYIGYDGRTKGGRCTMVVANDGDTDKHNARGEVYLNVEYMKELYANLGLKDGTQYLVNILAHEFTHANQMKNCINQISDSASRLLGEGGRTQDGGGFIRTESGKEIEMGEEGTFLTEANSDTAGLIMLRQSGEISDILANYYQKNIEGSLGWISDGSWYRDVLIGKEEASAIDIFHHYLQDKIEYLGNRKYMPLNFDGKEDWIEACYQEHLFGEDKAKFIEDTKEVVNDATTKYISQMRENLQNPEWLNALHPSPYVQGTNAEFLWESFIAQAKGEDKDKVPTFEDIVAQKNKYFSSFGASDEAFVKSDVFQKAKKAHDVGIMEQLSGRKQPYQAPVVREVFQEEIAKLIQSKSRE